MADEKTEPLVRHNIDTQTIEYLDPITGEVIKTEPMPGPEVA